jgi:hypothetical protein
MNRSTHNAIESWEIYTSEAPLLEKMKSEIDFSAFGGTFQSRYRYMQQSDVVEKIRSAIRSGEISEEKIRRFTERITTIHFKSGYLFPYESILANIAVALEDEHGEFADEYINDLADLTIRETTSARGVAQIVRDKRTGLHSLKKKQP